MAMRIVKDSAWVERVEYRLNFDIDDTSGLAFPCDKNGKLLELTNDAAKANYENAIAHPEKFCRPAYVRKIEWTYKEPAIGKCDCGKEFPLINEYMGACECPKCGKWYSMSGQELLPPDKWGWDGTPMDADY